MMNNGDYFQHVDGYARVKLIMTNVKSPYVTGNFVVFRDDGNWDYHCLTMEDFKRVYRPETREASD
jgi:hypothetical protein